MNASCLKIRHMHIKRLKSGTIKRRRHFNVTIYALLPQDRHFGPNTSRDCTC